MTCRVLPLLGRAESLLHPPIGPVGPSRGGSAGGGLLDMRRGRRWRWRHHGAGADGDGAWRSVDRWRGRRRTGICLTHCASNCTHGGVDRWRGRRRFCGSSRRRGEGTRTWCGSTTCSRRPRSTTWSARPPATRWRGDALQGERLSKTWRALDALQGERVASPRREGRLANAPAKDPPIARDALARRRSAMDALGAQPETA